MANIGVAHKRDDAAVVEHTGFRLSWGAIFAGFIAATMIHITLSLFGVAVGLSTWDVGDPASDLGMGVGIWMGISALIAYFVGGMTTGRLAGILDRGDGALHGLIMWGISTLANLWLISSLAGTLIGGAFGLVRSTVGAAAGGAVSAVGAAAGQAGPIDFGALQQEIETALEQTGDPALQPDAIGEDVADLQDTAATDASNEELAGELADRVRATAGEVDREDLINVMVARGMERQEAERTATRIENAANSARSQIEAGAEQAGETATDVAEGAEDTATDAAWWILLAMGLGLAAAAAGAASTARE